jgi:transcriptional regulator of aromatic amino acid metabolism
LEEREDLEGLVVEKRSREDLFSRLYVLASELYTCI